MTFFNANKLPAILTTLLAASSIGITACSSLGSNNAAVRPTGSSIGGSPIVYQGDDRIERHLYAGFGIGSSWKQPDTSEISNYDVNDRVDSGYQLTLGMDLSRQVAVELHTADIGDAGLSPEGNVNYTIHGLSALMYAGKNRHKFKRHGFTGFGRLGLGYLDSTADTNVEVVKDNATHILFGAGLEYMTRKGLGIRAEGILFEEDARYMQLGLIYRTGKRESRRPAEIVKTPAPAPIAPPVPAVAIVKAPIAVDTCAEFSGVLEGVNFHSGSDQLTDDATGVLNSVASRLAECSSVPIRISAHTDSQGAEAYNQNLSERRAQSVADYLSNKGINAERLNAQAFGETQPIESNATAEGRRSNRRVELITEQ